MGKRSSSILLVIAALMAVSPACGVSGPGPQPTVTPAPVPTDTPQPTGEADVAGDAAKTQADIQALFAPGEQAGREVSELYHAIADGQSVDMVEFYRLAEYAAAAWDDISQQVSDLRPTTEEIREAQEYLSDSARYRKEAYEALLQWVDSQDESDLEAFYEKRELCEGLLISGLYILVQAQQ